MSNLKKHTSDIKKVLINDETLLRLLYYLPQNALDDPLSPTKTNVKDLPNYWDIVDDRIVNAPKFDDLDTDEKCRLLFYSLNGRGQNGNYNLANRQFAFEFFVPFEVENTDLRLETLLDHISELLVHKRITGITEIAYRSDTKINVPMKNYLGHRIVFEFVSGNS